MEIEFERWIEWLKLKGLSDSTIKSYNKYFMKFNFSKLSHEYMFGFLKKNNNSVARAMLKNLIQFIKMSDFPREIRGLVDGFEIPIITGRKKQRIPEIIDRFQVHTLAKSMNHERENYMVLTTFYLGLRCSELLNLKIDDFNWEEWSKTPKRAGVVKIIGKGDKQRNLPVVPELMIRLNNWISGELEKDPDIEKIFRISERRWQIILSKKSKKIFNRSIHPHLLRHSCGTYLKEQGLDLQEIADFLGHSSIQTTQIYTHIDKKKLNSKILGAFTLTE